MALALAIAVTPRTGARADEDAGGLSEGVPRYESVVHARRQREAGDSLVLTGRELSERGANNLAEALDLLPELSLRPSGRGASRVDLRASRQASVLILVDGAPVNEPYFGDFDPFGDFDLLLGAARRGMKIVDVPVRYRARTYGRTNISRFRHGLLLFAMAAGGFRAFKIRPVRT